MNLPPKFFVEVENEVKKKTEEAEIKNEDKIIQK